MEAEYWLAPLKFIADTLATLYTGAVMLRLCLQMVRADYYNPISQFIVKITHPVLRPLRRVVPPMGNLDSASLVLMLLIQIVAVAAIALLQGAALPAPGAIVMLAVIRLFELFFDLYVAVIIGSALVSWIAPYSRSPAVALLDSLAEPMLRPARRWLPDLGGLDLSPLVVLMLLELARILLLPILQRLAILAN